MDLGMKAAQTQSFSLDPISWSEYLQFPQCGHGTQGWGLEGECLVGPAWVCDQLLGEEEGYYKANIHEKTERQLVNAAQKFTGVTISMQLLTARLGGHESRKG